MLDHVVSSEFRTITGSDQLEYYNYSLELEK
jgi:hypothetical protein